MEYIQQSIFDLTEFDDIKHLSKNGVEFWLARDLQNILQYNEWRNFVKVINKAKIACEKSGNVIENHFVDANKMVLIGSGTEREIEDIKLSRYACYLIIQNADARKKAVAQGQSVTFHNHLIEHYCMIIKPKKAASDGTIHYTTNEIADVINKALNMLQNITNFYNGKAKDSYAKILSITTISKYRIKKSINALDPIGKIQLSKETMDRIDTEIVKAIPNIAL